MEEQKLIYFVRTVNLEDPENQKGTEVYYQGEESVATGDIVLTESGQLRLVTARTYNFEGSEHHLFLLELIHTCPAYVKVWRPA